MRIELTALLLAAIATGNLRAAEKTQIRVYISTHDESCTLLGPGKAMASAIFEKIGVRVNWRNGELRAAHTDASQPAFGIRTVEHAPASASPFDLASARLVGNSGTEITVYQDHVLRFLADHPSLSAVAASYVLAHELAHVMQGTPRHSNAGILKAYWSSEDFQDMRFHKLAFTSSDVELIHQGLVRQSTRLVTPEAQSVIPTASNPSQR